ncbi:Histidine kinase 5 [Apostasia shenzhenica]|uniref:histidine kinase n=1 Tax=Apostasia shenzhenica TaxID=1088818 RepID=A0A2I0A4Z9_9ASPA|nr:Histidine kinase 5 [Apostasia shenzhenica]
MGNEAIEEEEDMDILSSMWPDDLMNAAEKQFNIESNTGRDMLEDVNIVEDPSVADFKRLVELTSYSEKGSSQLAYLVKSWEYKQANAARLLNEELSILSKQRQEAEIKKLEIIEAHRFEQEKYVGNKRPISILDEVYDIWGAAPKRKNEASYNNNITIDAEYDSINYWKQRAILLEKLLEESIQREQALLQKLQDNVNNLEKQSSPVDELSQILKRADNYLHFILQTAPVVMGHQDKELRYRFIYNHFPKLAEEDIIGKTDAEIFTGLGVKESQDLKREVLERGLPSKREITFETELFGKKTFLIYVEPVFSKAGETIGVNYMGMDVTDQVIKREKMAKLREEIAVQKAKETELNKSIHITEETMRAKQMLATMSHEIRSPLTGVVSMAEILGNTKLDAEQRQLLDVMISSGDLVLQLINDILDLSKVESGVMKLEAAKFRPREVVKHVLQTAAASLRKQLTLEGHVADDVPIEVIGDVLRIRQILTNLISNAVKFTHEGTVGVNLHLLSEQYTEGSKGYLEALAAENASSRLTIANSLRNQSYSDQEMLTCSEAKETIQNCDDPAELSSLSFEENEQPYEKIVLLHCDVYDTGIGIPEKALPSLFRKYMQASADHARKYGGTGLGLAICKQLVELMGGHLTVTSQVNRGSTFTFLLPCKVPPKQNSCGDSDGDALISDCEVPDDTSSDELSGSFIFKPHSLSSGFSLCGSVIHKSNLCSNGSLCTSIENSRITEGPRSYSYSPAEAVSSNFDTSQVSRDKNDDLNEVESFIRGADECHTNSGSNISQRLTDSICSSTEGNSCGSGECEVSCRELKQEKEQRAKFTSNGRPDSSETNLQPKILLVEDNKINIMVAQSMLKQFGYKAEVVNNGLEAIRAVQSSHYDLILMDVCMPVMDGLQATKHIRAYEENGCWDASVACLDPLKIPLDTEKCRKRTNIIAMTANALEESAAECLAHGMDSFVSKPVTFQKLKECLQQYLPC